MWYNIGISKKDKIDKSIAFHQAIMLALYATFVGLVGSIIYKKFCGLELGSLALSACVAFFGCHDCCFAFYDFEKTQ